MSCKEDSEQGQRCRNSIPEPRQEQVIKTSSARDGHGPKHAASPRKTPEEEEHSASLICLQISWRSFADSSIFDPQKTIIELMELIFSSYYFLWDLVSSINVSTE